MHQHPSWGLISKHLGTIDALSVHPASPILLTKNGPLGNLIRAPASMKKAEFRAHSEFENKLREITPKTSDHLLYMTQLKVPSYPERNFGGSQLLDSSMSLSPLYPDLTSDLHVSTACDRPPRFPLASVGPGKARYLSGPSECAQLQIPVTYDQDRALLQHTRKSPRVRRKSLPDSTSTRPAAPRVPGIRATEPANPPALPSAVSR